jgi:hypothetical protein
MGINNLSGVAIGVVVFIVVVAVGATVLDKYKTVEEDRNNIDVANTSTYTTAYNVTVDGLAGEELFGDFTSIVVIVAIASVILALIAVAFQQFT